MKIRSDFTPPLFGITNASLLASGANPAATHVPFGLYSLLFGSPQKPLISGYDDAGNVNALLPLRPLVSTQYLPVEREDYELSMGTPHPLALVADPANPSEIVYGGWDEVACYIAGPHYPKIKSGVIAHPAEGYFVAKFMADAAPKFARAGGAHEFDHATARAECSEMSIIQEVLSKKFPALRNAVWSVTDVRQGLERPSSTSWGMSN